MNRRTLEKLKQNPHYKISSQQYAEPMSDEEESRMIEIGRVPKSQSTFAKHTTRVARFERTSKEG